MSTGAIKSIPTFAKYRHIGTTDSVSTCDCCGRKNLKKTVCILEVDTGEIGRAHV